MRCQTFQKHVGERGRSTVANLKGPKQKKGDPKVPQFRLSGSLFCTARFSACGLTRVSGASAPAPDSFGPYPGPRDEKRQCQSTSKELSVSCSKTLSKSFANFLQGNLALANPPLATARRPAAGVALHTSSVPNQRIVPAIAAGIALVPLHLGLGPVVQTKRSGTKRCFGRGG